MTAALLLLASLAVGIVVMVSTAMVVFAPALKRHDFVEADSRMRERAA
jgi:hypothetical protein